MDKKYYDSDIEIISRFIERVFHVSIETALKERRTYDYLDKYMYAAKSDFVPFKNTIHRKEITRGTVWVCWLQGIETAPKLVKRCVETIQDKANGRRVILLSERNYKQYVRLPKEIEEKKKNGVISNTFFSDILRLALLAEYGGTWIDATIFCTGEIPSYMLDSEFFCFRSSIHYYKDSLIRGSNWWISANPKNDLICKTRNILYEYWKHEDKVINYFIFHLIVSKLTEEDMRCRSIWYSMPYMENSNSHILMGKMSHIYDEDMFQIICKNSPIHKLSYKLGIGGRGTYYSKLISKRES